MNNIISNLLKPLNFTQKSEIVISTPKPKKGRVSSHIYLDRIKYLNKTHKEEIAKLEDKIISLKQDIEILEISNSIKSFKEIGAKREEIAKILRRVDV